MLKNKPKKNIGLVLSGGAVLGIAHLGVLKVLEENDIPVDIIVGTSAGSLVGAFMAAGYSSDQLFDMVRNLSWSKISKLTIPKMGLLDSKQLEHYIDSELGRIDFLNLQKKFAAVAVDITTGGQVVFIDGIVSQAVRASCAIPGVFTPLVQDNRILVDGGVLNFLPTDVARKMGADYIIAVKLTPSISNSKPPENIIHILINSFQLALAQIAEHAPNGDVTIVPDLAGLNPHDFKQVEILYERGRIAALKSIDQVKQDLKLRKKEHGLFSLLK